MTTKAGFVTYARVRDIMTRQVLTLAASDPIPAAAAAMSTAQVTGAPVLHGGRVVGVVSKSDFTNPANAERKTVADIMTRAVYAVRPEDPAFIAVRLMVDERVHRVLAVDEGGGLVGIVTPMDVCRAIRAGKSLALDGSDGRELRYVSLGEMQKRTSSPAV